MQDVKLSVRTANINFSGTTWMSLLQSLQQARVDDIAQPNDYYRAMLNSCAVALEGFGGYSPIPGDTKGDASRRVSSGEWITTTAKAEFSRVTYVHELGHGQGLRHAPCGNPAGPDPNYPYAGAKIGVWGYDLVKSTFKDPAKTTDYKFYQGNRWVARAPASLAELPEGSGKYLLAQAPANFGAITSMVRVANGVRHPIAQTTLRRIIR